MKDQNKHPFYWFLLALALLFIALKLCGVINWSWWFVLIPLYAGTLISFCFLIFAFILIGIKIWSRK
jgi:hypothetical protein